MSRRFVAGVVLVSMLSVTISCVPPPRVAVSETTVGRPSADAAVNALYAPPSLETIAGDLRGEQIRLGYKVIVDTQEYGKRYVGNALNCTDYHLDAGFNPNTAAYMNTQPRPDFPDKIHDWPKGNKPRDVP